MTFVSDAMHVLIYLVYFVLISTWDEIDEFPDIFVAAFWSSLFGSNVFIYCIATKLLLTVQM